MPPKHNDSNLPSQPSQPSKKTQFLLGTVLGAFVILVPLSYFMYFTPDAVHPVHYVGSAAVVLICGALSAVLGDRFLKLLSALFESMPGS